MSELRTKVIGRRKVRRRVGASEAFAWQDRVAGWSDDGPLCDRGLFRFGTFEEADEWMIRQRAKHHLANQRRKTSGESRGA